MLNSRYKSFCDLDADHIRKELLKTNDDYAEGKPFKVCDVASLFVAAAYLGSECVDDKEDFRKRAYNCFLSEDRSDFTAAWELIGVLTEDKENVTASVPVKILKGGSYKIKNYYLENYNLNEIRGASILLTYVEDKLIRDIISEKYIPECIVYCGGGNIFAVVPESCDESFTVSLENEAKKYLISADIAYYLSDSIDLSVLFSKKYKVKMTEVENQLNDRKKLIINTGVSSYYSSDTYPLIIPESTEGMGDGIDVTINRKSFTKKAVCSSCGRRPGIYSSGKNEPICLSCLHKRMIGENAKTEKYLNMYEKYNGKKADNKVHSLGDLKDREGYIAVVYGDGNNMGGIIQQFTNITQMMKFSRDVKDIAARAVFESMGENGIEKFEVVGLGGDDIFVIVSGAKAIRFAVSLIKKYNEKFTGYRETTGQVSTMSVGIAIAKHNTPVQIILEEAENQLSDAKSEVKKYQENKGSMSFRILDSFDSPDEKEQSDIHDTMLPYLTETAESVLKFADKFKNDRKLGKTALRNILDAFSMAESDSEANLFFEYYQAKNSKIDMPEIAKYKADGGYYIRTEDDGMSGNGSSNEKYYLWKDLLNIIDFI